MTKRCCNHEYRSTRGYLKHKADEHTDQCELFARILGEDMSQPDRLNGDANYALEMLAMQSPTITTPFYHHEQEEPMDAETRTVLEQMRKSFETLETEVKSTLASASTSQGNADSPELKAILQDLSTKLEQLTVQADQDPEPSHPIGLCQEETCEICVAQGRALLETGRQLLSDEIDEALSLSAGETVRNRVAQLVLQGQALRDKRAQLVEIIP